MAEYRGVGNVAREISKKYRGIGNVSREVTKRYRGVGGVAREVFSSGMPVSELELGDSVYLNVNGTPTEFFIIHKGLPSTMYDNSCDGVWLLSKYSDHGMNYHSEHSNDYVNLDIFDYVHETFLNLLDIEVQNIIKQVKIPYVNGNGNGTVLSGTNGLSCKTFLLSACEVGFTTSDSTSIMIDGAALDYFTSAESRLLKRSSTSSATYGWNLRTPKKDSTSTMFGVGTEGQLASINRSYFYYARPALILPYEAMVDSDFNLVV